MVVGRIRELWRYPVKSMGGERHDRLPLGPRGIPGDRGWAVRDECAGEIRGAKKLPALLACSARYVVEPAADSIPPVEIRFPDGSTVRTDAPDAAARLSSLVDRPVTLWPLQPATALDHYRRAAPDQPDMLAELRDVFGRLESEPLPDLSVFPPEIMEYTSPLGTYFDAFPLHLLTTASVATLQAKAPGARFDVRRFRPNVVIETAPDLAGLPEADWTGKTIVAGRARIRIAMPCVRCVMTTVAQGDLPKDPTVLRTIVRDADQNLGAYATVEAAGTLSVGDDVRLE
jgi:uncharacterized protein YcbX